MALWAVRGAGLAVVVLLVLLLAVMPSAPVHANLPGFTSPVVSFELATEPEQVLQILGRPGEEARESTVAAMDLGNRLDFLFLVAYPALHVAIAALLVARGLAPRRLVRAVGALAAAMAMGDAVENLQLLVLSHLTEPDAMREVLPLLAVSTRVKWIALYVASALLAPFVWRAPGRWRYSALLLGAGAALGALGPLWPPGVEYGAYPLALAWLWAWGDALRARH
jgi:hypothetical protein